MKTGTREKIGPKKKVNPARHAAHLHFHACWVTFFLAGPVFTSSLLALAASMSGGVRKKAKEKS